MDAPLLKQLRSEGDPLDRFLAYVSEKGVALYPAQEEAILELFSGNNVILNTPTGSGKSLVAAALHFRSLADGKKSYYTSPIKALVNEKFLALCKDFGPDQVGLVTGDASVNPSAPIICCTAEVLSNLALRAGANGSTDGGIPDDVIMDEFHYYSDRERGMAWQVPLLTLSKTRFLLMSATLGDTRFFENCLSALNGRVTTVVRSSERPVPLDFEYSETPLHEEVGKLIDRGRAPIYLVQFTQRECAERAQDFLSIDFCSKDEKRAIAEAIGDMKFSSPYGKEIQRLLKHGVAIHHAGLLPKYRILVERLAQRGLLKLIFGTDTLGVGVNIPIRTVLFTKLCKFDGEKTTILSVRDFQQIAGRAGRKGFDDRGTVVIQAPEHVIENLANERKAAGDPKKLKKLVKRKPPEKGYLPWTKETFEKLVKGEPEALVSRFQVSHALLLNVLSRADDPNPCHSLRSILRSCHESDSAKRNHRKRAFQLFRSLVDRGIIELKPHLRVNVDLQEDFSLNHALSLYLIDTLHLLDRENAEYTLDLLTQVESILENPDAILRKQLDYLKRLKMDELKMQGMDFDERVAELEAMEYPKPNRDFVYDTFNDFAAKHPWIGQENIRPKSVAREMYETFQSFDEYIRDYGLQRVEGLLLRYLSDVYKVLAQTVLDAAKTDEVFAMEAYFRSMVRGVDSSLIDEWERMRTPGWVRPEVADGGESAREAAAASLRKFTIAVRNEAFRVVRALSTRDYEAAAGLLEGATAEGLEQAMASYYEDHVRILTDLKGRDPRNTRIAQEGTPEGEWRVHQILADINGHNDWALVFRVDLKASREQGSPVLRFEALGDLQSLP